MTLTAFKRIATWCKPAGASDSLVSWKYLMSTVSLSLAIGMSPNCKNSRSSFESVATPEAEEVLKHYENLQGKKFFKAKYDDLIKTAPSKLRSNENTVNLAGVRYSDLNSKFRKLYAAMNVVPKDHPPAAMIATINSQLGRVKASDFDLAVKVTIEHFQTLGENPEKSADRSKYTQDERLRAIRAGVIMQTIIELNQSLDEGTLKLVGEETLALDGPTPSVVPTVNVDAKVDAKLDPADQTRAAGDAIKNIFSALGLAAIDFAKAVKMGRESELIRECRNLTRGCSDLLKGNPGNAWGQKAQNISISKLDQWEKCDSEESHRPDSSSCEFKKKGAEKSGKSMNNINCDAFKYECKCADEDDCKWVRTFTPDMPVDASAQNTSNAANAYCQQFGLQCNTLYSKASSAN